MEKLISAYLHHIDHYLKDCPVTRVDETLGDDEIIFNVHVENDCLFHGRDIITVNLSKVLIFLFERGEQCE